MSNNHDVDAARREHEKNQQELNKLIQNRDEMDDKIKRLEQYREKVDQKLVRARAVQLAKTQEITAVQEKSGKSKKRVEILQRREEARAALARVLAETSEELAGLS